MSRAIHFGEDIDLELYNPDEASNGVSRVWRVTVTGVRDPGDGEWSEKISCESLCGRVCYWLNNVVDIDSPTMDTCWGEARKAIVAYYEEYQAKSSLQG